MYLLAPEETVILTICVTANTAIAAFVIAHDAKSATARLFSALNIVVSVWLIVMFFSGNVTDPLGRLWLARATLFLAVPMNTLFFLFCHTLPAERIRLGQRFLRILLGAAAVLMVIVATPAALRLEDGAGLDPYIVSGPGMAAFGLFSVVLNIVTLVVLGLKLKLASAKERSQIRLVLIGILVMFGIIIGTIFLPVLVFGDSTFVSAAPLGVLAFTALAGFAVFRRGMLNLKVLMAEGLSVVIVFVYGIQLIIPNTTVGYWMQVGTYVFIGLLVVALLRSTHNEEHQFAEMKRLAGELQVANDRLHELDEVKTEFISIASHQLRTPVSVMKGYLSLMQEGAYGQLPAAAKEKTAMMFATNERLVHLINNILNMSRIEKNRLEFRCSLTDTAAIAREVFEEVSIKAKEKGIQLKCETAPNLPRTFADSDKVHEIIINLLDNAIKYTVKGSVTLALSKRANGAEEWVELTVTDTGLGILPDGQKRLFEKFYRVDAPDAPRLTGTGLGLYICKRFVDSMGGTIKYENGPGGAGSRFTVLLPTKPKGECE